MASSAPVQASTRRLCKGSEKNSQDFHLKFVQKEKELFKTYNKKTDPLGMRFLYVLFILNLIHCSNHVRLDPQTNHRFLKDGLFSESEEPAAFDCQNEEDCTITETFLMDELETAVDILFVLDVSSSMKDNLKKLGSAMLNLLTYIQDFDWQMAFTTADHGDHKKVNGKVGHQRWEDYRGEQPHFGLFMNLEHRNKLLREKILKKSNKFYDTIFLDTLTIHDENSRSLPPFSQGDHEQPLRALKASIERDENKNFFRSHTDLIAFLITNEDERFEDQSEATTAREVVEAFNSQFSSDKNFYGFGILVKEGDTNCYNSQKRKGQSVEYGKKVSELARETHGENISICSDYSRTLEGVSRIIQSRVLDNVYLKTAFPKRDSIHVKITPEQNTEWKLEGRHIVFKPALKLGSEVQVRYTPR